MWHSSPMCSLQLRLRHKTFHWRKSSLAQWSAGLRWRRFESRHHIPDGHNIFSHIFVVKIVMFVWRDENKRKRGQGWSIFLKKPIFSLLTQPNMRTLTFFVRESITVKRTSCFISLYSAALYMLNWQLICLLWLNPNCQTGGQSLCSLT